MNTAYTVTETSSFHLHYHLVWCPRRRRAILVDAVKARLSDLLHATASAQGWSLRALDIQPDHAYVVVAASPHWAPSQIVARFKADSSPVLAATFPHLQRMPSVWTRSFLADTSVPDAVALAVYIQNQPTRG